MRAAKVQASLRIRAVSPEPSLLAHTSSESRGTFRQKARSLAPLNGWACAVKICHDGMLEDTNSLGGAQFKNNASMSWHVKEYYNQYKYFMSEESILMFKIYEIYRAPSSEFVSSSIPSLQISTAHAQSFRGARDLVFCLKVLLDSLLV